MIPHKKNYSNAITQREIRNSLISQKSAEEGFVLLKNNGILPLKDKIDIALYGAGARKTIKGGWGSGDVNERNSISIEKGLEELKYKITTKKWINDYDIIYSKELKKWQKKAKEFASKDEYVVDAIPFIMPCGRAITDTDIKISNTDTAIYVLSRASGEGADRKNIPGDYKLFDIELKNLKKLIDNYKNVILIINSGGIIDTSFLDEFKQISAILYMSQAGSRGGNAIANILSGKSTPSGKLSDTWAVKYEDYPNSKQNERNTVNVKYSEGKFVGYRYFDTFNIKPRFEFGYGLSYTDFSINLDNISLENDILHLNIRIKNIGKVYSGKEVVQVYMSGSDETINKEYQRLVGFIKTDLLKPDEEQIISYSVDFKNMKTYDEKTASWVIEKGKYTLRLGNSSRNTKVIAYINVNKNFVLQKVKNICKLKTKIDEFVAPKAKHEKIFDVPTLNLDITNIEPENYDLADENNKKITSLVNKLNIDELFNIVCGAYPNNSKKIKFIESEVPGACGETTSQLKEKYNIDNLILADGPAGLRLKKIYKENGKNIYQYCTAMPVGTLLAQTWNTEILKEVGNAISEEMQEFGVSIWLAPAMNIHRNPLCGRNFEYLSEDPLLTGYVAGNIVLGIQSKYNTSSATIKHFACNNRENNRIYSNSIVTEKTLREIYLRGFEIAIKISNPMAIMTSYNKINGIPTSNSYDLCTELLRNEWGFKGIVMTDWFVVTIGNSDISKAISAGNDLIMPGHLRDIQKLQKDFEENKLDVNALKKCAINILKLICK